jgi:hypothetical protein
LTGGITRAGPAPGAPHWRIPDMMNWVLYGLVIVLGVAWFLRRQTRQKPKSRGN